MKVLNLYAGIGGNRRLWEGVDVTAVELSPEIAAIYQEYFPDDKVIVSDAHEFLLKHYKDFDFIWSSPPCPTHSDIRRCGVHAGRYPAEYPDMNLYQEIILLKHFAPQACKWVVENVVGYYTPLIEPQVRHRHFFWSNFIIPEFKNRLDQRTHNDIVGSSSIYNFDISDTDLDDKRKILRNCVDPKLGLHVFESAFRKVQLTLDQ